MNHKIILEGFIEDTLAPRRITLDTFPYTIGRDHTCPLQLNSAKVSRLHAQLDNTEGHITVTDLHSTNGTFVNHEPATQSVPLHNGDVIHIGDHEFRVLDVIQDDENLDDTQATLTGLGPLSHYFPVQSKEFSELMAQGLVQGYAQLITDCHRRCIGYELLGRSSHPELQSGPQSLFTIAHALGEEIALSELFRRQSFADAHCMGLKDPLFFNTHPKECEDVDRLMKELESLRQLYPTLPLVCEIHEAAITDLKRMAEIHAGLKSLQIGVAYDDFGAGQARLLELVEVPPDILKFDYALISGLTSPEAPTFRLVNTLTTLVRQMGIKTLAEGIETHTVAQTCIDLGIDYFQGYFYGKPTPILQASIIDSASTQPLVTSPHIHTN